MNLDGLKIKPAEGKICVKFVDDDDDDEPADVSAEPVEYEGVLAIVVSVGAKVTACKAGDTCVMRPWARNGLKVGDDLVLCDAYDVCATISG